MIISAPNLFLNGAFSGPGAVAIEDGRIREVFQGEVAADIRLTHGFLSPGLIDLHNNGAFGVDCATATPAAWELYITELAARGVTSVLPTIITAEFAALHDAASRIAAAMARHGAILGLHLEGPFLAPAGAARTGRTGCAHRMRRRSMPCWRAMPCAGCCASSPWRRNCRVLWRQSRG